MSHPGFLRPLGPGLYLAPGPGQAKYPYCNSFLVCGNPTLLIDTGVGASMIREMDAFRRIDVVVLSHSHTDHYLNWQVLKDRRLWLPAETPWEMTLDMDRLGERFTGSAENGRIWHRESAEKLGVHPLRRPDAVFFHNERLPVEGVALRAIRAMGHLTDHYCFFEENSRVLLSTDVDFSSFGPWYGNPESDLDHFEQDIQILEQIRPRLVCSSHKPPLEGDEIGQGFADYRAALNRQIEDVFDCIRPGPLSFETLVDMSPFYKNRFPDLRLQRAFEGHLIQKILGRLERTGRIQKQNHAYAVVS